MPPRQHVDARQQLLIGEGLDQIVVRARVQADHTILDGVARGQKQHRCIRPRSRMRRTASRPSILGIMISSTITS